MLYDPDCPQCGDDDDVEWDDEDESWYCSYCEISFDSSDDDNDEDCDGGDYDGYTEEELNQEFEDELEQVPDPEDWVGDDDDNIETVESSFSDKIRKVASYIPFAPAAIALYYSMMDSSTPFEAKAAIAGALAYFILPSDLIPDMIPFIGYADDAAVIYSVFNIVCDYVTAEHYEAADDWLNG